MLKALTIFLGLLIIVSRGLMVIFPARAKEIFTEWFSHSLVTRGMGLFLLIFSALVFVAVRASAARATYIMTALAVVTLISGIWLVLLPTQYSALVNVFMRLPDSDIRVLAGAGVCIGVLILMLGIKYY